MKQLLGGQPLPDEIKLAAAQAQAVIDHAIAGVDALLTKHEGALAQFLDGFEITISFKRKP